jgi:ferric-dicitrate binding protein FerR (iron transport regulator)
MPHLLIAALLALSPTPSHAGDSAAKLIYVLGEVQGGIRGHLAPRKMGDSLRAGEIVQTGKNSGAIVLLSGEARLKLTSESTLVIPATDENSSAQLESGGVFADVAKKGTKHFFLKTKSAVMGVRGTQFFTAYGNSGAAGQDVWMCVHEGQVEVSTPQGTASRLVNAGEGVIVPAGKEATQPKPYGWTKGLNWNMEPSKGDVRDHTSVKDFYSDLTRENYD